MRKRHWNTLKQHIKLQCFLRLSFKSIVFLMFDEKHHNFIAEPPHIVPFSFGSEVVDEGAYAQLMCVVSHGDEPISLSWSLKGDEISSEPTLTTSAIGTRTSILIINAVGSRHVGEYTCQARNPAGVATYSTYLKVNGRKELLGERSKRGRTCIATCAEFVHIEFFS
jgi:hypothetical protein